MQIILGKFADKEHSPSAKHILAALLGLFLLAMVIVRATDKVRLFINVIGYGLAMSLMQTMVPFTNVLGTPSASEGYAVNFGVARGIGSAAYASASVLVGKVVSHFGSSRIPIVSILIYALLCLCVYRFPSNNTDSPAASVSVKAGEKNFLKRYPAFCAVLAAATCLYFAHSIISNFMFQIITPKGGNSESLGIICAIAAISELPTLFFFKHFEKLLPAGKWLVISAVAFFAKSTFTLLVPDVRGLYIVQALQILAYAVLTVASVIYVDGKMEQQDRVKGQAYFTVTWTVGALLASAVGGLILDALGVDALLITAIIFSAVGALLMWLGISKENFRDDNDQKVPNENRSRRARRESDIVNLTFDETNLLRIFSEETTEKTVANLRKMRETLRDEDADIREITDSALIKMQEMTEEEFYKLKSYPEFDR